MSNNKERPKEINLKKKGLSTLFHNLVSILTPQKVLEIAVQVNACFVLTEMGHSIIVALYQFMKSGLLFQVDYLSHISPVLQR